MRVAFWRKPKPVWAPIRTIFPFPDGWGVYCESRTMVLETGLATKELAQMICDEENEREATRE